MLNSVVTFFQGKKTYIVVIVTFVIAGLQANGVAVPQYVVDMLMALGLYGLRDAISKK